MSIKVAFDVDGVLCNFQDGFLKFCKQNGRPLPFNSWRDIQGWGFFDDKTNPDWQLVQNNPSFWLNLPRYENELTDIKVDYYITHRPVNSSVTLTWLMENGYPLRPVITTATTEEKLHRMNELNIKIILEDKAETVEAINAGGKVAFLLHRPWNASFNLPGCRVFSIEEFIERIS